MIINLEYNSKNARVSVRGLPRLRDKVRAIKKTSAGEVIRRKVLNGSLPLGENPGLTLLASNAEIDLTKIGVILDDENISGAYVKDGKAVGDFVVTETVVNPDGSTKEQKNFVQKLANVNGITPIKVAKNFPLETILTRFVIKATYQLVHEDGLSFHFLSEIAKELKEKGEAALVGSGPKGAGPIILRDGALPARGFLVGDFKDGNYKLLLLVSDMELRKPEVAKVAAPASAENDTKVAAA